MAVFKNFKHYPAGQWQQELVGYRDGKALGPPETTSRCSGPLDPKTAAGLADMAKASGQNCTTKVLIDQERLAESETVGQLGAKVQTVHTQMGAIDDRTILWDTLSTVAAQPGTTLKSKSTFLGACPAGAAPTAARPSAEDCAERAPGRRGRRWRRAVRPAAAAIPRAVRGRSEDAGHDRPAVQMTRRQKPPAPTFRLTELDRAPPCRRS